MWRFISCFVSKWFTAGKIIKSPGLYAESQIHHENCIVRYFQLKSQSILRWGQVAFPTNHTTTPVCEEVNRYAGMPHMHDNQANYLRKTLHLMMFFGAHREELYWLELKVSFLFLFCCKNKNKKITIMSTSGLNLSADSGPLWRQRGPCLWAEEPK